MTRLSLLCAFLAVFLLYVTMSTGSPVPEDVVPEKSNFEVAKDQVASNLEAAKEQVSKRMEEMKPYLEKFTKDIQDGFEKMASKLKEMVPETAAAT